MHEKKREMQLQQVIGRFVVLEEEGVSKFAGEELYPVKRVIHPCKGGIFLV